MSNAAREHLAAVERALCHELDAATEHAPDGDRPADERYWDAVLEEPVTACLGRPVRGAGEISPGRLEIKTCQQWISDYSSRSGRRRGRWTVHQENHDRRLDEDVPSLLVVLDDVDVRGAVLVAADVVDELLAGRWTTGDGSGRGRSAQLPWPMVFATEELSTPLATLDVCQEATTA